ncbi:MAG TPA: CRISPR-associated protein Cas4 [Anaerolineales bacterium]|nr:CRISPR-associated protein Cas4 [Anaerolineales bacterium]
MDNFFLLLGVIVLAGVALLLWLRSNSLREQADLPAGKVIYSDLRFSDRAKLLVSEKYGIAGKPDMLVKEEAQMIPVEQKSGRTPKQPYPGHVLQVAAYCLLIQENYHIRPTHGLIKYPEQTFRINFTPEIEQTLLDTLQTMHNCTEVPARSHQMRARCQHCGQREVCNQSLIDIY